MLCSRAAVRFSLLRVDARLWLLPRPCGVLSLQRHFTADVNNELRVQMEQLQKQVEQVQKQVEDLTRLIERQGTDNLVDLHNLTHEGDKATLQCESTFRPTIQMIQNQPTQMRMFHNRNVLDLAILGDKYASRESLVREIMRVDNCSWDDAHERLIEMDVFNERPYWFYTLPYRIGIAIGVVGAVGSCMMVFHSDIAFWYAKNVVGEHLPEGIETIKGMTTNQVGTWTWSWMEPMIGVASFILLCLQFARVQTVKMNMKPYTETMMAFKARRLTNKFPQYDQSILKPWARSIPAVGWSFFPRYRRCRFTRENRIKSFRGDS